MSYLAIFAVSLLVELSGALYTISVSHGNERLAVAMSVANSALGLLTMYLVIEDVRLFPAVIAGDTLGTLAALRLVKRGVKPRKKKMAGRTAHWEPTRRPGRQKLHLGD